jgi:hypothetical protein
VNFTFTFTLSHLYISDGAKKSSRGMEGKGKDKATPLQAFWEP